MGNKAGSLVVVAPIETRATWARTPTYLDDPRVPREEPSPGVAMSPEVQQICEHIEKGVESLLEAIGKGHKLWIRGGLNDADKTALVAAAALVGQRLGKPVR